MERCVTVLGSGGWGTALAILLRGNGHNVTLWSYAREEADELNTLRENKAFLPGAVIPEGITVTNDRRTAMDGAEYVVSAVPSAYVRETMEAFSPYFTEKHTIISVSKGFDGASGKRLSETIAEAAPRSRVAVLSGPSHAEEVARCMPTACVAASEHIAVALAVQDLFMNDTFRVYTNTDVTGVELGGALKNIIALVVGIARGLGFGDNTKAAIMTRGMAEIARLGAAMGANPFTFSGLSGVGDLIVTCTSEHSRNLRAGILIGQGKSLDETLREVRMVVEGANATKIVYELANRLGVEMPICSEAYNAIYGGKDLRLAVSDLMGRDKTSEHVDEYSFKP